MSEFIEITDRTTGRNVCVRLDEIMAIVQNEDNTAYLRTNFPTGQGTFGYMTEETYDEVKEKIDYLIEK